MGRRCHGSESLRPDNLVSHPLFTCLTFLPFSVLAPQHCRVAEGKLDANDVSIGPGQLLEGNKALNDTLAEFVRPMVTRTTLESDGYGECDRLMSVGTNIKMRMEVLINVELNMLQILPPNMDTSGRKKYPVLIRV